MQVKRSPATKSSERSRWSLGLFLRHQLARLPRDELRRPNELEIEGYCLNCGRVTSNRAVWVGKLLKTRRCESCGEVMSARRRVMAKCYLDEFADRLAKLPPLVKPEKIRALGGRAHKLPSRALRRAAKEMAYLSDLFLN